MLLLRNKAARCDLVRVNKKWCRGEDEVWWHQVSLSLLGVKESFHHTREGNVVGTILNVWLSLSFSSIVDQNKSQVNYGHGDWVASCPCR